MGSPDSKEVLTPLDTIAFLGALCLFLSVVEYMLPKPPPLFFFRLGLANIPILLSLQVLDFRRLIVLMFLKVAGQGLLNGTLASYVFLFSTAGTLASCLVMWVLFHGAHRHVSFVGLSVAGALASNIVQVFLSLAFIFGSGAWLIAPLFMGLGLCSGIATGLFAVLYSRRSRWYGDFMARCSASIHGGQAFLLPRGSVFTAQAAQGNDIPVSNTRRRRWKAPASWDIAGRNLSPTVLFWWGLALIPLFLFQESLAWRFVQLAVLLVLCISGGKTPRILYFLSLIAAIVSFGLLVPEGKVLLDVFGFHVTEGALLGGLYKGTGIAGLVFASLATVRSNLVIPGTLGAMLGRMFWFNEILVTRKGRIRLTSLVDTIDDALYGVGDEVHNPVSEVTVPESGKKGQPRNHVVGVAVLVVAGLPFVLPYVTH